MALKLKCQNCGKDIIVRFLKVGEIAECKSCGSANTVPETAVETAKDLGYSKCGETSIERYAKINFPKASLVMGESVGGTYPKKRYAKIVRSNDRFLVIRIQRFTIYQFIIILIILAIFTLSILLGWLCGYLAEMVLYFAFYILAAGFPLAFSSARRHTQRAGKKRTEMKCIFPEKVTFDKTLRKIEIRGKEERILSFDDVQTIRYGNTVSSQSSDETYHRYSLGIELPDSTHIVIANGNESRTRMLMHKIREVIGKPVRSDGIKAAWDRVFEEAEEKLKKDSKGN